MLIIYQNNKVEQSFASDSFGSAPAVTIRLYLKNQGYDISWGKYNAF